MESPTVGVPLLLGGLGFAAPGGSLRGNPGMEGALTAHWGVGVLLAGMGQGRLGGVVAGEESALLVAVGRGAVPRLELKSI